MLDNLSSTQKKIILFVGIAVGIGILLFVYNKFGTNEEVILDENILISNGSSTQNTTNSIDSNENLIVVHITGAVKTPGIVRLAEGSRIETAIEAAGGLTEDADISRVNLAYVLDDGIKLRIPSLSADDFQDDDIFDESSGENVIEDNNSDTSSSNQSVNINKATEAELQTLPGIGPSLASKIVQYREQNGKFSSIEDIKSVNGIGDSKYNNIKDLICTK